MGEVLLTPLVTSIQVFCFENGWLGYATMLRS